MNILPCRIEDYGLIGDCETAALVGRDGSIDWLCWPAFDSDACFAALLGTHRHGRWLIAPVEEITGTSRRYWDDTLILETRFETADGAVDLIDFMPPRGNASDVVRLVRGARGRVKMRMQLVIRFGFGADIPWVKKSEDGSALLAICGQDMTVLRTPIETRGEDMTTVAEFEVGEGADRSLRADLRSVASARAEADRPRTGVAGYRGILDRLVQPLQLRGRTSRPGDALADHAEGADYRPDRRHRRRAHDLAAGAIRRHAQLGLSLLLAARRHLHAAGADELGLYRRGGCLAPLAVARGGGLAGQHADHVRHLGPAAPSGVGGVVAARLRRRAAGADRQRRARAIATRRLWRTDRRLPPVARGQARNGRNQLGAGMRGAAAPRRSVGQARSRHLGTPRRGQALCLVQGDDVGRVRPRHQERGSIRLQGAAREMAGAARRHSSRRLRKRL